MIGTEMLGAVWPLSEGMRENLIAELIGVVLTVVILAPAVSKLPHAKTVVRHVICVIKKSTTSS
ncbi:MAG: hypothetical protein GXP04_08780 [Alphaproteobacteria bacterium]|nr:hypothetical protein [Alphaproteobacteria bacterium]